MGRLMAYLQLHATEFSYVLILSGAVFCFVLQIGGSHILDQRVMSELSLAKPIEPAAPFDIIIPCRIKSSPSNPASSQTDTSSLDECPEY